MISAIIVCGGQGVRAGFGFNKLLKATDGITPFEKCLSAFIESGIIDESVVVCPKAEKSVFEDLCRKLNVQCVLADGKETRSMSVLSGLEAAHGDVAVIHDGARPFVSVDLIRNCARSAEKYGSGIAAVPATDTICDAPDGENITRSYRDGSFYVQTPQAFKTALIKKAFSMIKDGDAFTDESGLFAKYIAPCKLVAGDVTNKKLTYAEDFSFGGDLFAGTGFDLHVFAKDRKLILGGVEVPFEKGLLGHSDADVLTHAIMDALLSSASLRDIGYYFPDTDEKYAGISSIILLKEVLRLLADNGFTPKNVTAVIMAQKPKLSPYVDKIKKSLANVLGLNENNVGITCTTLEGIGIVGREEGIAVQAYVLTRKNKN